MKFRYSFFLLFLVDNSFAQLDSYIYKRKLDKPEKESYYAIPLLPEVTAQSKSNLSDLRLYNINGSDTTEIPYLLENLGDKAIESAIDFDLINDVTHLKCCSYVTLKMKKKEVINRINLEVEENNFDKILTIEGSNDNKEWFTIRKHLRISGIYQGDINFRTTELHFQNAEFSYFRLSFDDDGSSKITTTTAHAFENVVKEGKYHQLSISKQTQTENKNAASGEKTSDVIVDLSMNYVVSHIKIKSKKKGDYYRNFNVYKSNGTYHTPKGEEENWEIIGSGVISSDEENRVELGNTQTRKLKIEILNYDDVPLELNQIEAYSEDVRLIANIPSSDNLYLAYGKANDHSPVYDLVHFKEKIPATTTNINYGKEEKKILAAATTTEPLIKNKIWLWVIMGTVILIIGYFALSMLNKETGSDN